MKKPNQVKTIVVLGMHRSGTSVTASVLDALGVYMGDNIDNKSTSNVTGHYEDQDFLALNRKILRKSSGNWNRPPQNIEKESFLNEAKQLVKEREAEKLWGWKDPRTVFTYDVYSPFLQNVHMVIVYRNPLSVAKSLKKRDGTPLLENLKLINQYNREIHNLIETEGKIPKIFISYESLLSEPEKEIKKIASFLDLNFANSQIKKTKKRILSKKNIRREEQWLNLKKKLKKLTGHFLPVKVKNMLKEMKQ